MIQSTPNADAPTVETISIVQVAPRPRAHTCAFPALASDLDRATTKRQTGELSRDAAYETVQKVSARLPNPLMMLFSMGD